MFPVSRVFTMTTTRLISFLCFALAGSLCAFSAPAEDSFEHSQTHAGEGEMRLASQRIATAIDADPIASPGQVVVVYFTPADIEPAANHTERIRLIVAETAGFYERELARHGFAKRTMKVVRNGDGEVDVIDVVGAGQGGDYGKPDGHKIRQEVLPVLRAMGIDPDASVILLFCNLMDYDSIKSTISHHSPYYGGGSHLAGTAWQCDSPILDPRRFGDLTPIRDGEYGNITIGRHNSIFIGGVIHELGHALSLPHCRQREDEAVRGTALMGSGNRTYGEQLRGEGRGTFLTQAHALRLASHPVFNEHVVRQIYDRPKTAWSNLKMDVVDDRFIGIGGVVADEIPVQAVVTYFDPDGGSNYDATTATAVPDDEGRFSLRSEKLHPGTTGEIRLTACHVSGATGTRSFRYAVDANGKPDLSSIRKELELQSMVEMLRNSGHVAARQRLDEIAGGDPELQSIGERVLKRFGDVGESVSVELHEVAANVSSISLSQVKPFTARVGWLRPTYNSVPSRKKLLSVDGELYGSGIYAHAPALHEYALNSQWKKLTGRFGIQDGSPGRVDFEIVGDGRLLWTQRGVGAGQGGAFDVEVKDVRTLSLRVGDGGNGNSSDWGVWIEPTLVR